MSRENLMILRKEDGQVVPSDTFVKTEFILIWRLLSSFCIFDINFATVLLAKVSIILFSVDK